MNLTILTDNLTRDKDLIAEHGLSFYIESGDKKILFDTGQSAAFSHNADKLGIDLSDVDYLVLSHGHFDHAGGISDFLELNKKASVILKPDALLPKFSHNKYIGIPKNLHLPIDRMQMLNSYLKISQQLYIMGEINITHPSDTHFDNFYTRKVNRIIPDAFEDELFLVALNENGLGIITACSHHGVRNIMETAKVKFRRPVDWVIGGFHLKNSDRASVIDLGQYLSDEEVENIITGHCTSFENYKLLGKTCKQLEYGYCGNNYDINTLYKVLKNENSNTLEK
jgi:7,8-dihydropterin-6-yl-methyl-4-(beta-D-ribofuranosyl)aminobenzene 5'-phosphate synthase